MNGFHRFEPDPGRAAALDRRMHAGLAESLEHLYERTAAAGWIDLSPLRPVIETAKSATRLPPAAFGWYYELGIAVFDGNRDAAAHARDRLSRIGPDTGAMPVVTLDDPHVTRHGDLYIRRMGKEAADDGLAPPPPAMADAFRARLSDGLKLLDRSAPDLAGEVRALVHEVLLATGAEGTAAEAEFDGASFYQLWGLLMLNPRFHVTPVAVAEVLAHESAHSLLFGFTYDEPLVLNPDAELYPSPLRRDPRPMDGIYHATFVSARMCWAMRRLASDRTLDGAARCMAEAAARRDLRNFASGDAVVAEHGRLSETGAELLAAAREYMAGAAQ